ncbi:MAG: tRNA (cytidine(34)-2'-O)-methyltransferase [Proteobacteria bacterium]|nr:tRNA (cytidine(34)-2'-O)-methyltransferase [Pseudomonadota bacterium]
MRLALYQPDIPQNAGTIMRLAACFGIPLDVVEPCGFIFSDTKLRRAGMDYAERAVIDRHSSWEVFQASRAPGRLLLMTTKAAVSIADFEFQPDDILMLGAESSGVPEVVHQAVDARVRVPMRQGMRSLNVAVCAGIVLWEAMRQTGQQTERQTELSGGDDLD